MSANTKTLPEIQDDLLKASALVQVVGWAIVGQDYAGQHSDINRNLSPFDIQEVTALAHEILLSATANLDAIERANTKASEVQS